MKIIKISENNEDVLIAENIHPSYGEKITNLLNTYRNSSQGFFRLVKDTYQLYLYEEK